MISPQKTFLAGQSKAQILDFFKSENLPGFRANQVHHWLYKQFTSAPVEMKNIPKNVQTLLNENFITSATRVIETQPAHDGTTKVLLELYDHNTIEAVLIPAPDRMTFCISSQVGCPVRCRFCASGAQGLTRNLTAGEIISQFMTLCKIHGGLPTNLVFMGIGEPLLNFEAVRVTVECLTDPDAFGFSPRRITISTSGITENIYKLAEMDKPFYLALSLHAVNDTTRAKLIPDAYRQPIAEILKACDHFTQQHNRLVTLEYTLIEGVNHSDADARKLAQIAIKLRAKVNVIAYNAVENSPFKCPSVATVHHFCDIVSNAGAILTLRMSKGADQSAACGQLRSRHLSNTTPKEN